MPNKDNLRLWVDALRSGEYKQGREQLHDPELNEWCCLGVACDVAVKNGVPLNIDAAGARFDGHTDYLPQRVMDWLGIDSADPELGGPYPATHWNDDFGEGFDGIANLIEIEYELTGRQ